MFDLVTWAYFAAINRMERLDGYIVNQYTNLLDKTNEDIFEGDIISIHTKDLKRYQNAEIIWSEVNYCWLAKIHFGSDFMSYYLSELTIDNVEIELVGNIYQNPELLKN